MAGYRDRLSMRSRASRTGMGVRCRGDSTLARWRCCWVAVPVTGRWVAETLPSSPSWLASVFANEAACLELGDVDWRAGEVLVRGKGSRRDGLPLPDDVGEAIVDYLRRHRPPVSCRQLFLRSCAPFHGLSSSAVSAIVRAACTRAGVRSAGAHSLRHGVARELLRQGAPLVEIGQLLRHNDAATTAICARVDRVALSTVALPWPGAAS
jgi:integrase